MTPRDFVYWLQGFFEISEAGKSVGGARLTSDVPPPTLNSEQVRCVSRHLDMVVAHINPPKPAVPMYEPGARC